MFTAGDTGDTGDRGRAHALAEWSSGGNDRSLRLEGMIGGIETNTWSP
jgi:hypothetical protein